MGKTRRKERSETEYLRGQVRELEKENRSLKKRLRQLDKRSHLYEDIIEAVAEDIIVEEKCPTCKTGKHSVLDLKHVRFMICSDCDYRKRL